MKCIPTTAAALTAATLTGLAIEWTGPQRLCNDAFGCPAYDAFGLPRAADEPTDGNEPIPTLTFVTPVASGSAKWTGTTWGRTYTPLLRP